MAKQILLLVILIYGLQCDCFHHKPLKKKQRIFFYKVPFLSKSKMMNLPIIIFSSLSCTLIWKDRVVSKVAVEIYVIDESRKIFYTCIKSQSVIISRHVNIAPNFADGLIQWFNNLMIFLKFLKNAVLIVRARIHKFWQKGIFLVQHYNFCYCMIGTEVMAL